MAGVILYGPPASGKDTITGELTRVDAKFSLVPRLKSGPGRTAGYKLVSKTDIAELRSRGEIVYENRRYLSTYALDRATLAKALADSVPVLHLGQLDGIKAVRGSFPDECWLTVSLWCPRDVAANRISSRNTNDDAERLKAWDETEEIDADLAINTAEVNRTDAALRIYFAFNNLCAAVT